jgi:cell division protein ZapA (FtsZ GTPase activity inhibitor)
MGTGGLTTTYNFTTQEKFADIDSINRQRIRKNQEDMLRMLKHTEEQIEKTKRDIRKYIK